MKDGLPVVLDVAFAIDIVVEHGSGNWEYGVILCTHVAGCHRGVGLSENEQDGREY
jgi:hypothetical protein